MKDSENKGKGFTAEGQLKDAVCVCGGHNMNLFSLC